jgi:hypothetical protein
MKAENFYKVLKDHSVALEDAGFKKKTQNAYVNRAGISLQFILNKWGWDNESGWGFLVRLVDLNCTEKSEGVINYPVSKDIVPSELLAEQKITASKLEDLYKPFKGYPKLQQQLEADWFAFYDSNHLAVILSELLPLIVSLATTWSHYRVEQKHPMPVYKKMSNKEWKETKEELDGLFDRK